MNIVYNRKKIILEIRDLHASIETNEILKGINLKIQEGEVHAIMGKNGSGKSTLAKIIAGHPSYKITKGDIIYDGKSILTLEPEERARAGIFLGFQYPVEIPGVTNADFLRLSYNARKKFQGLQELEPLEFFEFVTSKLSLVGMDSAFLTRDVNEGFSGGEKKRNEILQMALLDTKLAVLDETDSGLDIDALKIVASGINSLTTEHNSILLITHYQRLLDYIQPDYVHIMQNGRIIKTGTKKLALELERKGYDWLTESIE
uniref:Iron-sulfur cluster formation ABC transporter ATP-binding subunit n=1 Tax=Cryptomonas sp. SAG 977-2f TaxID=279061 RepID=A0A679CBE6_9CRYP|nr:iron-sulfur cluster formation ABC transporter ATP-binding subunit [Cryptomonas sp. SAG 977-2f]